MNTNNTMKLLLFYLSVGILFSGCQNDWNSAIPEVVNIKIEVDIENGYVAINYDIIDDKGDGIEVYLNDNELNVYMQVSNDGGKTFTFPVESVYGHVRREEVSPGTDWQILWHYDNDNIDFAAAGNKFVVKLIADDRYQTNIEELISRVDVERIKSDLAIIEGIRHHVTGEEHVHEVRNLIEERFASLGLSVKIDKFDYEGYSAANISAYKTGMRRINDLYGIGAHFDSVEDSPGAEDNGSGIAIMLEAARILSAHWYNGSLAFLGFDLEEEGLIGSGHYVENAIPDIADIQGVIVLDQVGYFNSEPNSQTVPEGTDQVFPEFYNTVSQYEFKGDFVWNIANEYSQELAAEFTQSALSFIPELKVFEIIAPGNAENIGDLRRSDHRPFWDANYPAILLSAGSGEFRNPYYHQESDTKETLNYEKMAELTRALIATMAELAEIRHAGYAVSEEFEIPVTAVPENAQ